MPVPIQGGLLFPALPQTATPPVSRHRMVKNKERTPFYREETEGFEIVLPPQSLNTTWLPRMSNQFPFYLSSHSPSQLVVFKIFAPLSLKEYIRTNAAPCTMPKGGI